MASQSPYQYQCSQIHSHSQYKQHSAEINRSAPQYKHTRLLGLKVSYDGHKKLQIQTSAGQMLFILTGFRVPTLSGNQAKPGISFFSSQSQEIH